MRSPTIALLWEIGRRNRVVISVIVAVTAAGRLVAASERASGYIESSALVDLSRMVSFGLLFGVFTYVESNDGRLGRFPRRLFTLPISTLRLVAVPVLAGIISVEILYLVWFDPSSRGGSTSPWFVALLLAASMVCYQAAFWTLDGLGPVRLIVAGALAFVAFVAGILPSFPPSPPPLWRSEAAMATTATGVGVLVFLFTCRHIAGERRGGGRRARRFESLIASAATSVPKPRRAFTSPDAAHFWFEWRSSGLVLPTLVGIVLFAVIGPISWLARDDARWSLQLLLGTLATPIIVAIPVGMAFARPTFWSDDLSMPAFLAVRPLTDEQFVAIKARVAATSAATSWLLVLAFLVVWLSLWGNLDGVSQFAIQLWAFHGHSVGAVYGIAFLIVIAGMFLTWRFLIVRLWSGLSGRRPLFIASAMSVVLAVIAWMVFDGTRLPRWVLDDPARMTGIAWFLSIAVTAKYWLAAYSWRRVSVQYVRQSLVVWSAGTACLLILAFMLWGVTRIYVALDIYRFQAVMILLALLALPLGRVGFAPSRLARNRHG